MEVNMKKQILTLTVCLALTVSSALAANTAAVKIKATQQTIKTVAPQAANPNACPCEASAPTKEQFKQKFEERMTKRREALYAKLGLSADQKTKALELDKKNRAEAKPLMEKLHEEKAKLNDMQSKKCCPVMLMEQKQKVKAAKKALRKHFTASEKNFEALLTSEQLTKFKAIKEERKANCKKHCKCKGDCGCKKHPHMFEPSAKGKNKR